MASSKVVTERRTVIRDCIRESDKALTVKELMDLTSMAGNTVRDDLKHLMEEYPQIKHEYGIGFIWEEFAKPTKKELTNSEGYSDPTAGLAMRMMSPESKIGAREVWEYNPSSSFSNGKDRLALVLRIHPEIDMVTCLDVFDPVDRAPSNSDYICFFEKDGHTYYVDTRKIMTKAGKWLTNYVGTCGEDIFSNIRKKVAEAFGAEPVTTVVDTKADPEPVVETVRDESWTLELELMKQKADIYEKAFYALCEGGRR